MDKSFESVKDLYADKKGEKFRLNSDISFPRPKNYTICFLRWLNKILKPFVDFKKDSLKKMELAKYFTSSTTTNFKCYLRLAMDFEMVECCYGMYRITPNGK